MPPRLPLHRVARHQPVIHSTLGRHILRRVHVHIDKLPLTRELPMHQRSEHTDRREVADRVIGLVAPASHRRNRVVVIPAAPHRPPKSKGSQVRRRKVAVRRILPERTDSGKYDAWRHLRNIVIPQSKRIQVFRLAAVNYHIRLYRQPQEHISPNIALDVQRHALFVRIVVPEIQAAILVRLVLVERRIPPRLIPLWRLHLGDVRTHIRQQLAAPSAKNAAHLKNTHIVEN